MRYLFSFLIVTGVCVAGGMNHASALPPNAYLFPTDASRRINSGFADYRASHFHAGIDISTNGMVGYPVFAAKDGYVYRVSVSPFGYGKMIVLRHDDSTYTVYAHLSGFYDPVERAVAAEQARENKYDVDLRLPPGAFRVSRGDVIAYTGATGVGGPHLHFEIRGSDYSPIDPLIYTSLDVSGYRTPKIFNVAVRGLISDAARVERVVRSGRDYRTRMPFRMKEPFYFIIHAADSYGRGAYKRPPKFIRHTIDDKNYLDLDLTRVNVDDYLDVSSLVDLSLSGRYKTYYRLCVDRAIPFSIFTPSAPASGLIDGKFPNGLHTYRISVEDEDGNKAVVEGKFYLDISPEAVRKHDVMQELATPFSARTITPVPGLSLSFRNNSFSKDVDVQVDMLSTHSFLISPQREEVRKGIDVRWAVDNPRLLLFRRLRHRWSFVGGRNDGKVVTSHIRYRTGEFALMEDRTPPVVGRIGVSPKNPFYRAVAERKILRTAGELRRVFVYFKVSDRLSGVDTDDILLKIGGKTYFCEYDVDKHAAVCRVDGADLRRGTRIEVVVRDNAGNVKTVVSKVRTGSFGKRI